MEYLSVENNEIKFRSCYKTPRYTPWEFTYYNNTCKWVIQYCGNYKKTITYDTKQNTIEKKT